MTALTKAMVLQGPSVITSESIARPIAKENEVLVRITHSGLCGTDLKIFQGAIPTKYPLIMGHEMVGEVVEGLKKDQRVIIDPVYFCGTCFHCRVGQTNLCPNGGLIGRDVNGGFAEYAVFPASQAFPLPDSIHMDTAALIQVATTCLHAQRLAPFFVGESVVVLGLGVSGQLHVQIAKARGAGVVIGVSRSKFKREMAQSLGADLTIEPGEAALQKIWNATSGRGADVVIDSTGVVSQLAEAILFVRFGGRIIMFGIISAKDGALPFYQLYFKELTLYNGRAAKAEDFTGMIDLVARGIVKLEPLITHRMGLGDLEKAIGMVEDGEDRRLKILLNHV